MRPPSEPTPQDLLARLRRLREQVLARRPCGRPMERALARVMDAGVRRLARGFPGCVLAVGGYGLGRLAPGSDLDLCLLVPETMTADEASSWVQAVVYPLWDTGMEVDYSLRTVAETLALASQDPKVLAGLLTARAVAGNTELLRCLRQELRPLLGSATRRAFVDWIAASTPSDASWTEPDLKNGPGGLRHWHHLGWLAAVFPGHEGARFLDLGLLEPAHTEALVAAAETVRQARCALHLAARRRHDTLHADLHEAVAQHLGLAPEPLFQRLHEAMARIRLARDAMLREVHGRLGQGRRRIALPAGICRTPGGLGLTEDPSAHPHLALRLLEAAARTGVLPCFSAQGALRRLTADQAGTLAPHLAAWLMDLLLAPHGAEAAETLLDLGLLEVLLPELGPCRAVVPLDGWHRYPVGRHSLRCALLLTRPEDLHAAAPWLATLPLAPEDIPTLVWAGLLHDMGKPHPRHEVHGSILARRLLARLGLPEADIQAVSALVRHHLLLFQVATQQDMSDPATVEAVAHAVGSRPRLAALAHLAVADAMATGPLAWNPWRGMLVAELCAKTLAVLEGRSLRGPVAELPASLLGELPESALQRLETTDLRHLGELLERHRRAPGALHTLAWPVEEGIWKCWVLAPDRPALFATLAGSLAVSGADILAAEIMTSDSGTAMDLFTVRLPDTDAASFWPAFTEEAQASLTDPHGLAARLGARRRSFLRRPAPPGPEPRVRLDPERAVLEVRASDRPGRLFDIAWELALHGVSVRAAKIATHGSHIHDIFFLHPSPSAPWRSPATLRPLLSALLRRLREEPLSPDGHHPATHPSP